MNINAAFPSKYLKASDAEGGDLVLTIAKVKVETIGQGTEAEDKPVIFFSESPKGMVCNKTNAKIISTLCKSDETADWEGKKIRLVAAEVEFKGDLVMSLRVRSVVKATKVAPAEQVEAPSDDDIGF